MAGKQPLTMRQLMYKTLSQGVPAVPAHSSQIKIAEISFEEFRSAAEKIQRGWTVSVYSGTDSPLLAALIPSELLEESGDLPEAVRALRCLGNLPFVFGLRDDGGEGTVHLQPKEYSGKLYPQLLWSVSESRIYKIRSGRDFFFIGIVPDSIKYIESRLNSDSAYLDRVRRDILAKETLEVPAEKKPSQERITVTKPLEFIIGSCFLPRQAYIGKKTVSTVFTGFSAGLPDSEFPADEMLWYRFWIESEGTVYSVFYSVDVKGETEKYKPFFEKLFKEMLRYAAVFLRKEAGLDRAGGGFAATPRSNEFADSLLLDSLINFETRQIACRLVVPSPFFADYLMKLHTPEERKYLSRSGGGTVENVLAVNSALFGSNVDTFYRQSSFLGKAGENASLTVSEIMSILNKEDKKRVLQNYFLANGWSPDKIQSLFMYKYYAGEEVKPKTARDVLFDKERYADLFPRAQREDWLQCRGVADSFEQLNELNREALEGIFSAVEKDKLILPYKAAYMLYNEFQKPKDELYKRKLTALLADDRASSLIPDIPRNRGQQAISSMPNGKLALALIAGKPDVSLIFPFMSRTKRQELEDELRLARRKYENGEINTETVYNELIEFTGLLEKLSVPEEESVS